MEQVDAVVIGSGFGGLGAALQLAAAGRHVVVCEALNYPGGCASTFTHRGARYDAGATLGLGLAEGELFRRVAEAYAVPLPVAPLDPVVDIRTPALQVAVPRADDGIEQALAALGVPAAGFGEELQATARALLPLLQEAALVPPPTWSALGRHLRRIDAYAPLLRQLGRPVRSVLRRHGLADDPRVRAVLEPLCRVTVQVGIDQAEAPFALGALAALARSSMHVQGGMGALASALVTAIEAAGGTVRFSNRVRRLERQGPRWIVHARRGTLVAPKVYANVLPEELTALGVPGPRALSRAVAGGWGAAMSYLRVPDAAWPGPAGHLDLCADPSRPYTCGNHVFCSVGGPGEQLDGLRPVVASTHVPATSSAAEIDEIHRRMRRTIDALAPRLAEHAVEGFTASPRTFRRFTRRTGGLVGGIPRRAGLRQYGRLLIRPARRGLYLVGDSVLLGQSTLAAALSGIRIAAWGSKTPIRW